jgi:hypothetical protein
LLREGRKEGRSWLITPIFKIREPNLRDVRCVVLGAHTLPQHSLFESF